MVPKYSELMLPLLQISVRAEIDVHDAIEQMAEHFSLNAEERRERVSDKSTETRLSHRTYWARTYLKKAGLVEYTKRRHFIATQRGIDVLAQNPLKIDRKFLLQFPEFQEFVRPNQEVTATQNIADVIEIAPQDQIASAAEQLRIALKDELLDALRDGTPEFFEKVIVDLLLRMGFGANTSAGMRLGGAGDNGVDGVIDQDALGVDQVYIQAKRYARDNKVGSSPIREFFGALSLKDVQKGIFVTTSGFTAAARETAEKLGARIILIDGDKLAGLMVDFGIGCRVENKVEISRFDQGYFE